MHLPKKKSWKLLPIINADGLKKKGHFFIHWESFSVSLYTHTDTPHTKCLDTKSILLQCSFTKSNLQKKTYKMNSNCLKVFIHNENWHIKTCKIVKKNADMLVIGTLHICKNDLNLFIEYLLMSLLQSQTLPSGIKWKKKKNSSGISILHGDHKGEKKTRGTDSASRKNKYIAATCD
jgi:hypothetical protein